MKRPYSSRSLTILLVAGVFIVLAISALAVAPRLFVLFDEAYNLNVSKTLATQLFYASRIGDWYRPFDPEVSTGPALLAPLAVAIRLGGATIGAVRLAMVVCFLACLLLLFLAGRTFVGTLPALAFVVVAAWTPLALEYGLSVLGDVPAAALAIAGLALLRRSETSDRRRLWWLVLSGLALGLALLAKDIVALLVLAVLPAWAAGLPGAGRTGAVRRAQELLPVIIAAAMAAGWRLYQVWAVQRLPAADAYAMYSGLAADQARRVWSLVIFAPLSRVGEAWRNGQDYYLPVLLALAVAVAGFVVLRRRGPVRWVAWDSLAERSLAAGCALWLGWYFLISGPQAFNHHLLPGILLAELLALMLAARLNLAVARERLLAGALAVLLLWSVGHGVGYLRLYLQSSEPRLAMQMAAAGWLRANTPPDAVLTGWNWYVPWHIAFLAGRNATRIDSTTPDLSGGSEWFVLSPEIVWGNELDARLKDFLARQGTVVVEQRLYVVYRLRSAR